MSYTGNGASSLEGSALREVEQGVYPQESAISVTPAMTVLLTTPQSGSRKFYRAAAGTISKTDEPS